MVSWTTAFRTGDTLPVASLFLPSSCQGYASERVQCSLVSVPVWVLWLPGPLRRSHTQQHPQALCLSCPASSRLRGKNGDPSFLWLDVEVGQHVGLFEELHLH